MSCLFVSLGKLVGLTAGHVRTTICDYMERNLESVYQGMPLSDWIKWQQDSTPTQYIKAMRRSETWGGAMEIAMFTRLFKVDVHVYTASPIRRSRLAEFVWDDTRTACVQIHITWNGYHYEPLRRHSIINEK